MGGDESGDETTAIHQIFCAVLMVNDEIIEVDAQEFDWEKGWNTSSEQQFSLSKTRVTSALTCVQHLKALTAARMLAWIDYYHSVDVDQIF